jgi:hypothetical protein
MFSVKYLSKLSLIIVFLVQLNAAATITSADDTPLNLINMRITNVPINPVLYPGANLPQACCIHPYNPEFHSFPVVVNFTNSLLSNIPSAVLAHIPDSRRSAAKLYLNVQDTPWAAATPALVRAHALFPSMGNRHATIKVVNDSGNLLVNATDGIHSHDSIASPNNFPVPGLDINKVNALWSIVEHGSETFVTRHVLLPIMQNEQLTTVLFDTIKIDGEPESFVPKTEFAGKITPKFFIPLLTADWADFLKSLNVTVN